MLEDLAKDAGFATLVKEEYSKGKDNGIRAKERDMNAGLSRKEAEKERKESTVEYGLLMTGSEGQMESGYGNSVSGDHFAGMILRPSMVNLPESTSRMKAINRPSQLRGFKPLYPRI
ncbi:MAG: hypothetical protein R2741_01580 [Methanolobus sp.]